MIAKAFLYGGALGGWLALMGLVHIWSWSNTRYVFWLVMPQW